MNNAAVGDMPTFASSAYASNTMLLATADAATDPFYEPQARRFIQAGAALKPIQQEAKVAIMATPKRRMVQVFVVDTNENVPIKDCLLYEGEPMLTDLTDQELYYDLDMKALLAAHNEKRVKIRDKTVKDREEFLEPARVRDLTLTVTTIASF